MAYDFPTSPILGQSYNPAAGGPSYAWDGTAWRMTSGGVNSGVFIGDTPPPNPVHGQLFWESDTGNTFIYYQDANSGQWVQFNVADDAGTDHIASISADMYAGFKTGPNHFTINDKVDGTGVDLMQLTEASTLNISSIDAGSAGSPSLVLNRFSPSPAASDYLGQIVWVGNDSTAANTTYARILAQIVDPINGSEDSNIAFAVSVAGALTTRLTCNTSGVDVTGDLVVSADLDVNGSTVTCTNLYAGETSYGISGVANVAIQAAAGISVEGPSIPIYAGKIGGNGTLMSIFQGTTQCGSITVANAATTAFNTTSDIRIKTGVKGAENARTLVDAVQVIEFEPVTRQGEIVEVDGVAPGPEVWMGFSAQQVYGVFPTAVAPPDPNILDYKPDAKFGEEGFVPWMLDYSKFVPMLMANVQELNARNDALEARLAALEAA